MPAGTILKTGVSKRVKKGIIFFCVRMEFPMECEVYPRIRSAIFFPVS